MLLLHLLVALVLLSPQKFAHPTVGITDNRNKESAEEEGPAVA
jgi:hypothetical protein